MYQLVQVTGAGGEVQTPKCSFFTATVLAANMKTESLLVLSLLSRTHILNNLRIFYDVFIAIVDHMTDL